MQVSLMTLIHSLSQRPHYYMVNDFMVESQCVGEFLENLKISIQSFIVFIRLNKRQMKFSLLAIRTDDSSRWDHF